MTKKKEKAWPSRLCSRWKLCVQQIVQRKTRAISQEHQVCFVEFVVFVFKRLTKAISPPWLCPASLEKVRHDSYIQNNNSCSNGDMCYIQMFKVHFPCHCNLAFALISVHFGLCGRKWSYKTKLMTELRGFTFITMLNNISGRTEAITGPW